jgi:hypothetical protein
LGDVKDACANDPERVADLLSELRSAATERLAAPGSRDLVVAEDGEATSLGAVLTRSCGNRDSANRRWVVFGYRAILRS